MRAFLGDQLAVAEQRLQFAEDSLEAYRTRYGVVAIEDRASSEVRALTDIRARRDLLEAERVSLSRVLDAMRRGGSARYRELATLPSFVNNDAVTRLVASLVDLENRRSDLAVRRTEANPELAALDERIGALESQVMSMGTSYASALQEEVASLDGTLRGMNQRLSTIPERQVALARLTRGRNRRRACTACSRRG